MARRFVISPRLVPIVIALAMVIPAAHAGEAEADVWRLPRTVDGHPDFQGVWANNNAIPLERPEAWADKDRLTDDEVEELRAAAEQATNSGEDALFGDQLVLAAIAKTQATSYDPTTGNYNQFWIADRDFSNRTSLVIDPPDGHIPALTEEAQERSRARAEYQREHPADSWLDRRLSERCVSYGVPRIGAGYNSYYQIFQSADYVVILMEMIHDARVIPLASRAHLRDAIRQYHGDSLGHWEGDTLVIETTNYSPKSSFRGSSDNLHVVERFTRVGPTTLDYEVTINDPTTWTKPWTVMVPLKGTTDPIFEYACHEGNYGMEGILAGQRAVERAAVQAATSSS